MAKESWIEPKSRIHFVGIVAIVIIVAVVAVFIKTQLGPLFPKSEIEVKETSSSNSITGRASSSFVGLREIDLHRKERLTGVVNMYDRARVFSVDVADQTLLIQDGGFTEEVILVSDGQKLTAVFDYSDRKTRVDVDLSTRNLIYNEVDKMSVPITVSLAEIVTYEGDFKLNNKNLLFIFDPVKNVAIIRGDSDSIVSLNDKAGYRSGTWQDSKTVRPVVIDTKKLQATIEDVY